MFHCDDGGLDEAEQMYKFSATLNRLERAIQLCKET